MHPALLPSLRSPAHARARGMSATRDHPATVFASRKIRASPLLRAAASRLARRRRAVTLASLCSAFAVLALGLRPLRKSLLNRFGELLSEMLLGLEPCGKNSGSAW